MTVRMFQGYTMIVVAAIILAAAVVFLALQWGNGAEVTMYGPLKRVNTAALIACAAVGGVVIFWLVKVLIRGIKLVRCRETA